MHEGDFKLFIELSFSSACVGCGGKGGSPSLMAINQPTNQTNNNNKNLFGGGLRLIWEMKTDENILKATP